jgi:hypothetical protein
MNHLSLRLAGPEPRVANNTTGHRPKQFVEVSRERELQAALGSELPGETIAMAYQRREHELCALFASLSVAEARALHRRLMTPHPDDLFATTFQRMIAERRHRLLVFLGDARRREAVRGASW